MAGPLIRVLAQIALVGTNVMVKAFAQAYQQAAHRKSQIHPAKSAKRHSDCACFSFSAHSQKVHKRLRRRQRNEM